MKLGKSKKNTGKVKKKSRKENFTKAEKNVLRRLVYKYKDILTTNTRKTNENFVKNRRLTWVKLALEFNGSSHVSHPATPSQLKRLYENMKNRKKFNQDFKEEIVDASYEEVYLDDVDEPYEGFETKEEPDLNVIPHSVDYIAPLPRLKHETQALPETSPTQEFLDFVEHDTLFEQKIEYIYKPPPSESKKFSAYESLREKIRRRMREAREVRAQEIREIEKSIQEEISRKAKAETELSQILFMKTKMQC